MPTSDGRFKGISVPSVPWLEKKQTPTANQLPYSQECDVCSLYGYCEEHGGS